MSNNLNPTRAQQVQSALTLIGKLFVEEMDAGTDNWHARYLQAQKDKDRLACTITELESKNQDLTNALQGREETLKGWQTSHAGIIGERDQWAMRFKGLDADMRGTMVTLEQEREQVKLLKKSNQHVGLANDDLVREAEMYKKTDDYLRGQISEKTKENCALYDKNVALTKTVDELHGHLNSLMKENAYLHDKIEELTIDVQSGKDTITCLEMAIERLRNIDRDRQEAHNEMHDKVRAFEAVVAHLTQKGDE
jgi:predicted nuclease with TOPRIM domain